MKNIGGIFYLFILLLSSCTFVYPDNSSSDEDLPNLIMEDVEYVRVRSSDPTARFRAEYAERYEKQQLMKLRNFTFEQFGDRGREVNAFGKAGAASIEIDSGDIYMDNGVRIEVESEDIAIETRSLDWKDEDRILSAREDEEVNISQSNGTGFAGVGFRADARRRSWEFSGSVGGTFIQDDDEEETELATELAALPEEEE